VVVVDVGLVVGFVVGRLVLPPIMPPPVTPPESCCASATLEAITMTADRLSKRGAGKDMTILLIEDPKRNGGSRGEHYS
jgi:hypothetical protein